jgi:tRNA(His) guanylyltransferase
MGTNGKNSFSSRMKNYEQCYNQKVPNRSYVIVRLDGVGFSKYTKQFNKPFDDILSNVMDATTIELCKEFQPKLGYTQSDEISLIFTTIDNIDAENIYDGKVQKIASIFASQATEAFNFKMLQAISLQMTPEELVSKIISGNLPQIKAKFDARVFVIPDITEVYNYFVWRQQDCTRNSISMAASANFPHKLLEGVSGDKKQDMLFTEKGINWNEYAVKYKRGVVVKKNTINVGVENGELMQRSKWLPDYETPIFTQDKEYLQNLIPTGK